MEILIILFLILLNGVFSMSEIALISARKNRLETAAKKGNTNAKVALDLANSPNKFLSTVQIGITLIGILTGIYSGEKITHDMQAFIATFSVLKPYSESIGVGVVVVILTFFSLVLGELLPKRIGLNYPEAIAKGVAVPMKMISIITMPFIWLLTKSTDFVLDVFKIKPTADGKVTEEEIKAIIKEGTEGGEVQEIEQDIVERVFHIGDRKINSLMTHRQSIVYLSFEDTIEELKTKMFDELHSFYPVCQENLDDVIGVALLKDLFVGFEKGNFELKSIVKEPVYMIEHTSAYKALENFKKSKVHYAFVTDEYGVFQGIITLNDILEALVGDAADFDDDEYQLVAREDGTWLVDGLYSLHDFLTYFDMDDLTNDYEVTTVSGLIMTEMGKIPVTGEKLIWNKLELEVIDMDGVKIDKVLVKTIKE
ncbi:HlyC/CorC family transporter [Flavobacterium silvisoli]|uniref:HlyC/CorC family transporter n=1 Tax=Flavobacterium silvisoli TaxID=2529433 RepID=A0A4V2L4Q6_9FLAO|nr:hemolysin family protein [Flavobacterium silvisoli]TBX67651.1 HlyC/CorC family transporter [Flavobacterium silvisoli]